jgi:hypothetical protein
MYKCGVARPECGRSPSLAASSGRSASLNATGTARSYKQFNPVREHLPDQDSALAVDLFCCTQINLNNRFLDLSLAPTPFQFLDGRARQRSKHPQNHAVV